LGQHFKLTLHLRYASGDIGAEILNRIGISHQRIRLSDHCVCCLFRWLGRPETFIPGAE
jgi:hypothetical protein